MVEKVEKKRLPNKLIKVCGLYRNISKQTGREYFSGTLSFTTKLLILQNRDARAGEPPWTLYLAEREQKPVVAQEQDDGIPDPGWPTPQLSAQ